MFSDLLVTVTDLADPGQQGELHPAAGVGDGGGVVHAGEVRHLLRRGARARGLVHAAHARVRRVVHTCSSQITLESIIKRELLVTLMAGPGGLAPRVLALLPGETLPLLVSQRDAVVSRETQPQHPRLLQHRNLA